ncbi:Thioredoxin-like protein [Dioscorea alata]|uniref:Thioredoxin-like protein n=2 Tax=Dioscorea alata TaxID=55571 RepID=A0ACB7WPG4_DIOAL|nr:Thioredoxin-like protein [Dioscorea alata]KAH7690149.1 Thioredoxin-like protein [Dioscorea alata]
MAINSMVFAISRPPPLPFPSSPARFKRAVRVPFRCSTEPSPQVDSASAHETSLDAKAPEKASLLGNSAAILRAGLGGLGLLETGYLTYLKLTNSEAFCPVGGGSCSDVLNSDYSSIFGIPLPLVGMVAYGLVTLLSLQQIRKDLLSGLGEADARLLLLGTSTSMAAASGYFLYILSTKLAGTSCSYCIISAILSFGISFITLKDIGMKEVRKVLGLQLAVAGAVIAALSYSYTTAAPQFLGSNEVELEPFKTEITSTSTPWAISLAEHLHSIGAKMYGAFWCTHCQEQKQMFGKEAAKKIDYVECYPDGIGKDRKIAFECILAGVEGFPTWIINGQHIDGERELKDLAEISGFVLADSQRS